jgi:hypothetical protein
MTQADITQYMKDHIKEYLPTSVEQINSIKLEIVDGEYSDWASKNEDGTFTASAAQTLCPEGSILIGGRCGVEGNSYIGYLQTAGLSNNHKVYCDWGNLRKAADFKAWVYPTCLHIKTK